MAMRQRNKAEKEEREKREREEAAKAKASWSELAKLNARSGTIRLWPRPRSTSKKSCLSRQQGRSGCPAIER